MRVNKLPGNKRCLLFYSKMEKNVTPKFYKLLYTYSGSETLEILIVIVLSIFCPCTCHYSNRSTNHFFATWSLLPLGGKADVEWIKDELTLFLFSCTFLLVFFYSLQHKLLKSLDHQELDGSSLAWPLQHPQGSRISQIQNHEVPCNIDRFN